MRSQKRREMKRKIVAAVAIFLAALMILSAIAPFLFAAEIVNESQTGISIKAEAGYHGLYKVGYPAPVKVNITNNGGTVTGEIQIKVPVNDYLYSSSMPEGPGEYITYAYPITLNENSAQEVSLEVSIDTIVSSGNIKAEFVDLSGKVLAQSDLLCMAVDPENIFIAVLSDNAAGLSYLQPVYIEEFNSSNLADRTVNLGAENFPSNLSALSAFNVIYINDFDTLRLSPSSLNALDSWVKEGGVLFAGTGENFSKVTKGLGEIVDITSASSFETDDLNRAFGNFDIEALKEANDAVIISENADGAYQEKTVVAVSAGGRPPAELSAEESGDTELEEEIDFEAVEASGETHTESDVYYALLAVNGTDSEYEIVKSIRHGAGKVVLFAFDLAGGPVAKSSRLRELIAETAAKEVDLNFIRENSYTDRNYIINEYNLQTIPAQSMGIIKGAFAFILLYVIFIGTGLYIILKKKDRREMGFIAIPAIAAVVTSIVFGLSFNTIYKMPVLNSVGKIILEPGQSSAVKTGTAAVLSGTKGDIRVKFLNNALDYLSVGSRDRYYRNGFSGIKLAYGPEKEIIYSDSVRWQLNMFLTSESVDLGGTIEGNMVMNNGVYEGELINNTSYGFKDVLIKFGEISIKNMGDLDAGESLAVNVPLSELDMTAYYDTYALMWEEDKDYGNDPVQNWNRTVRQSLADVSLNEYYYGSRAVIAASSGAEVMNQGMNQSIRIFAFTDAKLGEMDLTVNGKEPLLLSNSLVEMSFDCPVVLSGNYLLPYGYITPSSIYSEDPYEIDSYSGGYYVQQTDKLDFTFTLDFYESITSLQFDEMLRDNNNGGTVDSTIYNVKTKEWEPLVFTPYKNAQDYFDSGGNLLISTDCSGADWINAPLIQIEGVQ